jgi:hypothetical protein
MATIAQALAAYNAQNGTNYATAAALGTALTTRALRDAWVAKKRNDANEAASGEVIS